MAAPSDRERLVRLETRAREAEVALRQLKSYVQLLNQKAGSTESPAQEAECKRVEAENRELGLEVDRLKERLVELEVRNGIMQVPNPRVLPPSQAPPTGTEAPPPVKPLTNGDSEPVNISSETNKAKGKERGGEGGGKGKKEKKSSGGGGAGGSTTVDVSRLDFKIGRIVSVERHPDADSLYVEQIDLAEDKPRTVCSGLVAHVEMEDMKNRLVVILCNLKPVKMRGVVSEAMVMCASSVEKIEILDPPSSCVPGDRVTFEGYIGTPDAQLNPKKKVFEQVQPELLVNDEGVATYRGVPFNIVGKGVCRAASMRGSGIK